MPAPGKPVCQESAGEVGLHVRGFGVAADRQPGITAEALGAELWPDSVQAPK
jgi:hypothetical protein